ncbi:Calnexin, partial [Frankliniella fusca]
DDVRSLLVVWCCVAGSFRLPFLKKSWIKFDIMGQYRLSTLLTLGLLLMSQYSQAVDNDDDGEVTVEVEDPSDYTSPQPNGHYHFAENFDDIQAFKKNWVLSEAKKEGIDEDIAKYDGVWEIEAPVRDGLVGDLGLVLKSKAKHAAISSRLKKPFHFHDKPFVVQYEVLLQEGQECGGSYLKLLSADPSTNDLRSFHDKTPYSIMFGPDKCGNDHKLHFIFRHKNPKNGTFEEKHCSKPKERLEEPFKDKQPHLYTLIIRPDNTFQISVDHKIVKEGSLLEDFTPAVNPPAEIDDPNDKKPADWDETEKIPDPDARKPADWDESAPAQIPDPTATKPDGWLDHEPEMISDPNAEKPDDWDNDMDGEWAAPLIPNPACEKAAGCGKWSPPMINNPEYKGKWRAPLVPNPNYQGRWKPRRIANPDFFEDKTPFRMTSIVAVGFELWSMSNMILFDNLLITDDPSVAAAYAADSFDLKRKKLDQSAESLVTRIINYSNENPWLYAIYIVAVGLPLVLIAVFCCSSSESEEMKKAARAKKTDMDLADDVQDMNEMQDDLQEDQTQLGDDDEEDEEEEDEDGDDESETAATSSETSRTSKTQLDLQENEQGAEGSGDAPRSPRKRRTRKD